MGKTPQESSNASKGTARSSVGNVVNNAAALAFRFVCREDDPSRAFMAAALVQSIGRGAATGRAEGDLVAVHRTAEVRNRQIVVARLENEVTVKRYRQQGSIVYLMPENSEFEPIRVDLQQEPLLIEGVVVGVLRRGASVAA